MGGARKYGIYIRPGCCVGTPVNAMGFTQILEGLDSGRTFQTPGRTDRLPESDLWSQPQASPAAGAESATLDIVDGMAQLVEALYTSISSEVSSATGLLE